MVIYFNHWFSSIYNTIVSIKEQYPSAKIIISSKNKDAVYSGLADVFLVEPSDSEIKNEGVRWYLDVCSDYHVDIFFCKRYATLISLCEAKFNMVGTTIVVDNFSLLSRFLNKAEAYRYMRDKNLDKFIPDYRVVYSTNSLERALYTMLSIHEKVVIKLASDEGGDSVRIINNRKANNTFIDGAPFRELTIEQALNSFRRLEIAGRNTELLVMPYIDSEEISIDCYKSKKGFIAIPRIKGKTRVQEIKSIPELEEVAKCFQRDLGIKYPFNIQFRRFKWIGDVEVVGPNLSSGYKLLDINLRLSGGAYMSEFTGMNIPLICLKDILGDSDYTVQKIKPIRVGYVEHPVLVEGNVEE